MLRHRAPRVQVIEKGAWLLYLIGDKAHESSESAPAYYVDVVIPIPKQQPILLIRIVHLERSHEWPEAQGVHNHAVVINLLPQLGIKQSER